MGGGLVLGLAATCGIFLALPFFQLMSTVGHQTVALVSIDHSKPPPAQPPDEKKIPPEKEKAKSEPKLKQAQPRLTLAQLAIALSPGMGDGSAGGTFSMNFEVSAMDELAMIFDISEVDRIPRSIYRVTPLYPYEMKQAGISGSVSIVFVCDTQGRVRRMYVKSSSSREFEESAMNALRNWMFEPGMKDGKPVNVRMIAPFNFNLTDS